METVLAVMQLQNVTGWVLALLASLPVILSFTDYLENTILNRYFGGVADSVPATVYVGLSTTAINDDGSGVTEPVGGSYGRVALANDTTSFPSTATGVKSNGVEVAFPTATASWGECTHFFIADAASGGNMMGKGALQTPKTVDSGDTARFAAGTLTISLD